MPFDHKRLKAIRQLLPVISYFLGTCKPHQRKVFRLSQPKTFPAREIEISITPFPDRSKSRHKCVPFKYMKEQKEISSDEEDSFMNESMNYSEDSEDMFAW